MAFTNPITGGQGALVRPAIKSPGFVTGVSGWTINRDGSAEFNNLTIRGTFKGTNFELDTSGMFFYSGTPAHGNLIASIANTAGTDAHSNPYPAGFNSQLDGTTGDPFALMRAGQLILGQIGAAGAQDIANAGAISVNSSGTMIVDSPLTATFTHGLQLLLEPAAAGSKPVALFQGQTNTDNVSVQAIGAFVGGDPTNGVATWQVVGVGGAAAYAANWASSTTFNGQAGQMVLRYRLTNENAVRVVGCAAATTGANIVPFILPAGFRPTLGNCMIPAMQFDPTSGKVISSFARVDGSGNIAFATPQGFAAIVNGTQVWIDGVVQIGTIT